MKSAVKAKANVYMLIIIFAGLIGSSLMIAVMSFISFKNIAHVDLIQTVGTLFTENESYRYRVGLIVHYCIGVFFAFLYALLVSAAPIQTSGIILALTLFTGLVHGLVVSFLLIVEVAEHHPIRKYRREGVPVALSHIVGHIFYGFGIGVVFYFFHTSVFSFVEKIAEFRP